MAKNKTDSVWLLGGAAFALWLFTRGSASASAPSESADDWSDWDDAEVLDVTPNVPAIPRLPAPLDNVPQQERGDDGGLNVDGPAIRPSSPAEIQSALGRPATAAETAAYEAWRKQSNAQIEADRAANAAKTSAKNDAAAALKAAQLASKAPTAAPAKQAAGNKVSAALRELVVPTASAQAPAVPAPARATAKPLAKPAPARAAAKPLAKPAAKKTAAKPVAKSAAKPAAKKVAAPAGTNVALAKQTAPDVAAHIRNKGTKYTAAVVKQFQQRAGMKADGLYGPATASALRYFGANAPAPLFKGVNAKYVPPT